MYIFSPASFFHIYIHTLLQYYYMFLLEIFPRPGLELSSSRRVCGFFLICLAVQDQGRFSSSIATIRAPAANLGLLAPLLANHLGSQDNQHEYISLHALNPLCPGLEPATAPLALAEVCVIRVNWACNPLAL